MADRVRFSPIYLDNKKQGTLQTTNVEVMNNGEQLIGTEGHLTVSDGAITCTVEGDMIVTTAGSSTDLLKMLLARADVQVGLPVNGKFAKFTGRLMSIGQTSTSKTGVTTGKFKYIGGQPDFT